MKVPASNVVQMPQAQAAQQPNINPTMLAMAAALMHQQGRFADPKKPKADDNRD